MHAAWSVDGFNHSASLKFARGCWQQHDWMGVAASTTLCPHRKLDKRLSLNHTDAGAPAERYINVVLSDTPLYLTQKL